MTSIKRKHQLAVVGARDSQEAFDAICQSSVVHKHRKKWEKAAKKAMHARAQDPTQLEDMDIFNISEKSGEG